MVDDIYTRAAEALSEYNPTPLSLKQDFTRANLALIDAGELARLREAPVDDDDLQEALQSRENEMNEARRDIRQRLLGTGNIPLLDAYYKALTLSEHEAYRRGLMRARAALIAYHTAKVAAAKSIVNPDS